MKKNFLILCNLKYALFMDLYLKNSFISLSLCYCTLHYTLHFKLNSNLFHLFLMIISFFQNIIRNFNQLKFIFFYVNKFLLNIQCISMIFSFLSCEFYDYI